MRSLLCRRELHLMQPPNLAHNDGKYGIVMQCRACRNEQRNKRRMDQRLAAKGRAS